MNSMRDIRIEKVVVNIGVGEAGDRLLKAQKVLEKLTGQQAIQTLSKSTVRDWGIRKGMPIGAKVTLRGEAAERFLKEALWARNNILAGYNFGPEGNFSFGMADYTDFKDMKYDPEIGLFGMDVSVSLQRPGYRVGRRRIARAKVPHRHRVTRHEVINYVSERFDTKVRG
ncbi:MAG: 50S ribosomal protein L5 [Thermoplasmata archaeon]